MLKNFLKLTLRNLLKNKTYVMINILGLGLALACCITAYLNYDFGMSYDKQHVNREKIFKIQSNKQIEGNKIPYGITPLALGNAIQGKSTAVSHQSRYGTMGLAVLKDNQALNKFFGFVDKDFLDMFTFPMKYGDATAIRQKGSTILSEELSEIIFGEGVDPVGQLIQVVVNDRQVSYTVGGVFEKIPDNVSMHFQAVLNFEHYLDYQELEPNNWKRFIAGTFIMLNNPSEQAGVTSMLQDFIPVQNVARKDWIINDFYLEPLTTMAYSARDIRSNWGI